MSNEYYECSGCGKVFFERPYRCPDCGSGEFITYTVHAAGAGGPSPSSYTYRKLVMVELAPDTAETEGQDRCGHSLARVKPADAASTALSFPVTTGE